MKIEEAIIRSKNSGALLLDSEMPILYNLATKYVKPGGIAIEIGCMLGGSACLIGAACQNAGARLLCVDCFSGDINNVNQLSDSHISKFIVNTNGLPINILSGNSFDIHKVIADGIADLVFIDADHSYEAVKSDIINYGSKLKRGGLLCGHDYQSGAPGVIKAVDELLGVEEVRVYESIWARY